MSWLVLSRAARPDEALAFIAWGRCAGEQLKTRTKPIEFFEKRLVVAVKDLTWRRNLEELSPQLVAKLNAVLRRGKGEIHRVSYRTISRARAGKNSVRCAAAG
jgi:hypothetical protein